MMFLRNVCGIRRVDREMYGCELSVLERIERNMLKWFGKVKVIGKEKMVKRGHQASVEIKRGRGRPQSRWRDEVKELLMRRGLSEREGMVLPRDRGLR